MPTTLFPVLTLPIKKKWFDMILSEEKKEEYRDIKPYYDTRLEKYIGYPHVKIAFRNGYSSASPMFEADCTVDTGTGNPDWGAKPGKGYYRIHIREITRSNIRIRVDIDDFGIISVDAVRYCIGRQTYMPSLVRGIIEPFLDKLPDKYIQQMKDTCGYQKANDIYGDPSVDKPGWELWEVKINDEIRRRKKDISFKPAEAIEISDDDRDLGMLIIAATRFAAGTSDADHANDLIDACLRYLPKLNRANIGIYIQDLDYFERFDFTDAFSRPAEREEYEGVARTYREKWGPAVKEEAARRGLSGRY